MAWCQEQKEKWCHLKARPLLSRDRLAQLLWELASAPEELFHLGSGLDSGRRLGQVRQEFWVRLVEIGIFPENYSKVAMVPLL